MKYRFLILLLIVIGFSCQSHSGESLEPKQLIAAVISEDTVSIGYLFKQGMPIDTITAYPENKILTQYAYEWTALGAACRLGKMNMVKFLLKHHANIEKGYYDQWFGYSSLFAAAEANNLSIVKFLIKNHVNVNQYAAENGYSSLIIAIKNNNEEIVECLLKNGASPNKDDSAFPDVEPWVPLNTAIENKNIEIMKLLLEYKANPNESNSLKLVDAKDEEMLSLLKKYGAK